MFAALRLQVIPFLWVFLPLMSAAGQMEDELLTAIRKGDVASVKTLLTKGANDSGTTIVFNLEHDRVVSLFVRQAGESSTFKKAEVNP